ncbi:MAG: sugar-transfer associated ATP-grasp domain-containing protein [Oscillospiraceae bacterium]
MKKLSYLFKRIFDMDYKQMLKTSKTIHERTGKNTLFILFDIIICGFKYQAGYMDYLVFEFYNLKSYQRKTYITRGINNSYVRTFNNRAYWAIFSDKIQTLKVFKKVIGRKWLYLLESDYPHFEEFVKTTDKFVVKPIDGTCGRGVDFYESKDINDIKALYKKLGENNQYLVEEFVNQHSKMSKLYSGSVNTLRIVTILKDGIVHFPFCSIRIGNGKNVDNLNSGGMASIIDYKTGIITKPAADKDGKIYINHPISKTKIVGFKIPMFYESIELIKVAAKIVPEVAYVGWDIAITENGPVLIEANQFPGHDIYQFHAHLEDDKIGLKPVFDKILNS